MNEKILVVDDDEQIIVMLEKALTLVHYMVYSAKDSHSAIQVALTEKPDLILLDYKLSGISGIAVQRAFQSSEITKHIPVIMMTGYADDAIAKMIDTKVVTDYIIKPFSIEEIGGLIQKVLDRNQR